MYIYEWHQKLLDYYFKDEDGRREPVARLFVSESLFDMLAEQESGKGKDEFLRFFDEDSLEERFDTSAHYMVPIVLTLLAATALDERTAEEGHFRKRIEEILGFKSARIEKALKKLPTLWKELESWLNENPGYRTLKLPENVGRETLIGYSKRLVFPFHDDYKALAEIINSKIPYGTTYENAVAKLRWQVSDILDQRKQSFKDEFRIFYNKSFKNLNQARETPFWKAVEAIDWVIPPNSKEKRHRIFFPRSVHQPSEYLESREKRGRYFITLEIRNYNFIFQLCQEGSAVPISGKITFEDLLSHTGIEKSAALKMQLFEGCLGFSKIVNSWRNVNSFPNSGQAIIVGRQSIFESLPIVNIEQRLCAGIEDYGYDDPWCVSSEFSLEKFLKAYYENSALELSMLREPSERISIEGTLCVSSNAYLFRESDRPRIIVENQEKRIVCKCNHLHGKCYFWPKPVERNTGEYFCSFYNKCFSCLDFELSLSFESREDKSRKINMYRNIPWPIEFKSVKDENDWLCCNSAGHIDSDLSPQDSLIKVSRNYPISHEVLNDGQDGVTFRNSWELTLRQADLLEILGALFNRHTGLDVQTLMEKINILGVSNFSAQWDILRVLEENQWLRCIYSRHWSSRKYLAVQPQIYTIEDADGKIFSRLVGFYPEKLRENCMAEFKNVNVSFRVPFFEAGVVFGTPIIDLEDKQENVLDELAIKLKIRHEKRKLSEWRFSPHDIFSRTWSGVTMSQAEVTYWDGDKGKWVEKPLDKDTISLKRYRSTRRDRQDEFTLQNQDESWHWNTRSREWALWMYYIANEVPAYKLERENHYVRDVKGMVYIPLPLTEYFRERGGFSGCSLDQDYYFYFGAELLPVLSKPLALRHIRRWDVGNWAERGYDPPHVLRKRR